MYGPLYHLLVALPIFAIVLLFIAIPLLQWISNRLFHRDFTLRFTCRLKAGNKEKQQDVLFSILAFVLALAVTFVVLELLILKGILPPHAWQLD
jgi:hypothetical protein